MPSTPDVKHSLTGGARPASALAYAATPTHDSAVGHAAEAAVRPASPRSPKESATGLGRALSPRQFYEQVRPWTSCESVLSALPPMESLLPSCWRASADQDSWAAAARRADGTRDGGPMFIQVHQRAPAGESERGGGGNEAPGGGGGPADLYRDHDSRPLSGRLMFIALFPLRCVYCFLRGARADVFLPQLAALGHSAKPPSAQPNARWVAFAKAAHPWRADSSVTSSWHVDALA